MCVRWLDSLDSWLAGCYGGRRERRRGVSGGYVLVVLPCGFAACFASLRLGAPVVALETIYRRRQRHRCRHSRDLRSRTMRNCATWHVGCQAGVQQCGGKAKQFAQERLESRVEAKDLAKKEFLDKQIEGVLATANRQTFPTHTHAHPDTQTCIQKDLPSFTPTPPPPFAQFKIKILLCPSHAFECLSWTLDFRLLLAPFPPLFPLSRTFYCFLSGLT